MQFLSQCRFSSSAEVRRILSLIAFVLTHRWENHAISYLDRQEGRVAANSLGKLAHLQWDAQLPAVSRTSKSPGFSWIRAFLFRIRRSLLGRID
jgi:hypothetical protein